MLISHDSTGVSQVSVTKAMIPAGHSLYVQSTSPNRKLGAGELLVKVDGPAPAPAAAAAAAAPKPAKPAAKPAAAAAPPRGKKRKPDSEDDENAEDAEEGEEKAEGHQAAVAAGGPGAADVVVSSDTGSTFARARADGETVQEVCERLGLAFSRGCGYYLLSKTEDVRCVCRGCRAAGAGS